MKTDISAHRMVEPELVIKDAVDSDGHRKEDEHFLIIPFGGAVGEQDQRRQQVGIRDNDGVDDDGDTRASELAYQSQDFTVHKGLILPSY